MWISRRVQRNTVNSVDRKENKETEIQHRNIEKYKNYIVKIFQSY